MSAAEKFTFKKPLIEGLIKSRPNRFIMDVEIGKKLEKCHCPSTGRIGNIFFSDIPCLLSKSTTENRKTSHTVEAISIDNRKSWIGINQTAVNGYVEHFLKTNQLISIAASNTHVLREQTLGASRLDFRVGNTFIEIKMPLMFLPVGPITESVKHSKFNSFDRLIKHFTELGNGMQHNERAILLLCFVFDAPKFSPPAPNEDNMKIVNSVNQAIEKGVEIWQLNLGIDKNEVSLIKYFDITGVFENLLERFPNPS